MKLIINGQEAVKGTIVKTFRGTLATLVDWHEPGTLSGGNGGRVVLGMGSDLGAFYPGVIGGRFVEQ